MLKFLDFINEKLITFGGRAYPRFGQVVIMAGGAGCYPAGTEFFNGVEWKAIEEYKKGDKVLQFDKQTGKASLAEPLSFVNLPVDQFININNRRINFTTSLDHTHLVVSEKTGKMLTKKTTELLDTHENTVRGNRFKLVKSFDYSGTGIDKTDDQIRLHIAIIANGHSLPTENKFRMSFKKEHKIVRFEELLTANGIEYKKYEENGFVRFEFYFDCNEKDFESYWYNCNKEQLKVVADEVLKWDGCVRDREDRKQSRSFSTTSKKTKDFIQFVFTALGNTCTVYEDTHKKTLCYDLRISHSSGCGLSKNERSDKTTTFDKVGSVDGRMYCFETETGFFVVRQNNQIFVSGNSGKGFQSGSLLGIEGKVFDVDALKKLAIGSKKFSDRVKQETGHDIKTFDLRVPENVSKIHELLADVYRLPKNHESAFFASVLTQPEDRKPNILFDVTLRGMSKLESITRNVLELGYKKENIHIVWVVNDVKVAMKQNQARDRVVPEEILMDTHRGAAITMKEILSMGDRLKKYMDGDIWLTFNQVGIDTFQKKSDFGGSYIVGAEYIKVKSKGKAQLSPDKLHFGIYAKIKDYVPEVDQW